MFSKYSRKAAFRFPVELDYSEVRSLSPVRPFSESDLDPQPLATVVGDVQQFLMAVAIHQRRFAEWSADKEFHGDTESEFLESLCRHAQEVESNRELLIAAIAAYGEVVRQKVGGVWKKAKLIHPGEPVVGVPGRPWKVRRVLWEVVEALNVDVD